MRSARDLLRLAAAPRRAWHGFRRVLTRRRAQPWVRQGRRFLAGGEPERALACCRRALSISAGLADAYDLMIQVLMPGDDYRALLGHMHESLRPGTYLEIGAAGGVSLALAGPDTRAIGVDPTPAVRAPLRSHAKVYELTSDEFFRRQDLLDELGSSALDMAFIDGLHEFGQTLKDFVDVERYSHAGTIVLLHDCLPVARLVASRVRKTGFWCGDVWKMVPCLLKHRPDLEVRVVPASPSGLAIVTHLDPGSTLLRDGYEQIVSEYRDQVLDYEYLDVAGLARMAVNGLPNDWRHICRNLVAMQRGAVRASDI